MTASSPVKGRPTLQFQWKVHSSFHTFPLLAQSYQHRAIESSHVAVAAGLCIQSRFDALLRAYSRLRVHYPTLYRPGGWLDSWGSFHSHLGVGTGLVWRAVDPQISSWRLVPRVLRNLYLPCGAECAGPGTMHQLGFQERRRTDAIGFHALNDLIHTHSEPSKPSMHRMMSFGNGHVVL